MREFFKGWRRKAGSATLALACVIMVLWIRSLSILDKVVFSQGDSCCAVFSMDGMASWRTLTPFDEDPPPGWSLPLKWTTSVLTDNTRSNYKFYWNDGEVHWHWSGAGFDFGTATFECFSYAKPPRANWLRREEIWQVPYFWIVMPVIFVAAILLFCKPRPQPKHPVNHA